MLPFNGHVTSVAIRSQVVDMVCGFPITVKISPRPDVMDVECFAGFILCNAATLTSVIVSFSGFASLFPPVWPAGVVMPALPCWAVFCAHVSRFTLPVQPAINVAEHMRFHLAWDTKDGFAAKIASAFSAVFVQWMIFPSRSMAFFVLCVAFSRTESVVESLDSIFLSRDWSSAIGARYLYGSSSGIISALRRTVFLPRVIAWWKKRISALFAWFFFSLASDFIGATNRAKSDVSICAFFHWLSASFACFHVQIIAQKGGLRHVR